MGREIETTQNSIINEQVHAECIESDPSPGDIMIKQIGEKWTAFWRTSNNWVLAADVDPLEDLHTRVRRLELAVFQSQRGKEPGRPPRKPGLSPE
jgi:hypothetical protein